MGQGAPDHAADGSRRPRTPPGHIANDTATGGKIPNHLGIVLVFGAILILALLGLAGVAMAGGMAGDSSSSAGIAGVDLADNETNASAESPTATQTLSGSPALEIQAETQQFMAGSEGQLAFTLGNDADLPGNDSHPDAVRERLAAADEVAVDIPDDQEVPVEVLTEGPDLGTLNRGEDVTVSFTLGIQDDAAPGEYELAVEIAYVDVTTINYTTEDGEVVTSERTEAVTETGTLIIEVEPDERNRLAVLLWLLPAVIPVVVIGVWLAGKREGRTRRGLNRLARVFFDGLVTENRNRKQRIEAAYIGTNYRTYAAKTLLLALLGLIAGAIAGAYFVAGVLTIWEPMVRALAGLPNTITRPLGIHSEYTIELATGTRWLIVLGGGTLLGVLVAALAYSFRWQLPASDAAVRRRGIEEGLPRTTAFMYALSRGGMEFPQIIRTLTDYRGVYGETADEMTIAVREMDLFGRDMITALRRMAARTPSEQFKTFSENLTSVLQSGSDLPTFFKEQYERFRDEAEERQEDVLELLATIAEAYVTIFVAGMLFFLTILLVFGLTVTDTLWLLQLIIYAIIPLANAGFALFLQQQLDALGVNSGGESRVLDRMQPVTPFRATPRSRPHQPDGGVEHLETDNRRVLRIYDRLERIKGALKNPVTVILWDPMKLLWVTVPIAVGAFLLRAPAAFQAEGLTVRILDDLLIQSVLFLLVTYAVARWFHRRHIQAIESATPELLERLASLNEAGMSVVQGLDRVRGSDLGVLSPEVDRIWRDIEYGANVDDALIRFGRRVRTSAVARIVTLLTNAMRASGNMGPILRIASEQARAEVKLRRQRRQQMMTYLVVIYVSFFVFLVIILAVNEVLVPSLPDTMPSPATGDAQRLGASPDALARFGEVDQAAYTLVFFHAALIQAVCAGFIAGQLGEGSLRDGAKHAAIMLGIAYVAFVLLSAPIASITVESQEIQTPDGPISYEVSSDGTTITDISAVTLSEGGFVAVYDQEGINGTLLGHTDYLAPGSHSDLEIDLDVGLDETTTVRLVVHRDTNGNEQFDFQGPYLPDTSQVDRPYSTPAAEGEPGIPVRVFVTSG